MSRFKQKSISIKLIIFDAYGVVLKGGYQRTAQYLARRYHRNWLQIYQILYSKYYNQAALRQISQQAAWQKAIFDLKLPLTVQELKNRHYQLMSLNQPVIKLIKKLPPPVKMVLLTKNTRSQLIDINKKFNLKQYLPIINTWELQLPKASPRTLAFLAKKFRVKYQEMVYIDDLAENLAPARALGVQTILYQTFRQVSQELKELLC